MLMTGDRRTASVKLSAAKKCSEFKHHFSAGGGRSEGCVSGPGGFQADRAWAATGSPGRPGSDRLPDRERRVWKPAQVSHAPGDIARHENAACQRVRIPKVVAP